MTQPHRPDGLRLGFGTGAFNARGDRAAQIRLLHAALDAGITHIDTARLYGDGTAEPIVGEALEGRRGDVFLTSKGGIAPPVNGTVKRAVNKALKVGRRLPGGQAVLPEPSWNEPHFGQFDIAALRASLETSLRALKTDYLDLFLLHEVDARHLASGELVDALEQWKREGLLVSYGIGSTRRQTKEITAAQPDAFSTIQMPFDVFDGNAAELATPDRLLITHSWLGAPLARFQSAFQIDRKLAEKAGHCLYADVRRPHRLARCLLEHALHANPEGQVLFSTSRIERLHSMVRVAEKPRMTDKQIGAMRFVVQRIIEIEAANTGRGLTSETA